MVRLLSIPADSNAPSVCPAPHEYGRSARSSHDQRCGVTRAGRHSGLHRGRQAGRHTDTRRSQVGYWNEHLLIDSDTFMFVRDLFSSNKCEGKSRADG